MEGINKIVTNNLVSLSEQELIDCDSEDYGCHGGEMQKAFQFVIDNGGIDTEADYPFIGTNGTCDAIRVGTTHLTSLIYKPLQCIGFGGDGSLHFFFQNAGEEKGCVHRFIRECANQR
jgi:hypothetical protein